MPWRKGGSGADVIGNQGVHGIVDTIAQIVADGAHTVQPDGRQLGTLDAGQAGAAGRVATTSRQGFPPLRRVISTEVTVSLP